MTLQIRHSTKKRRWVFRGIGKAAVALGVDRNHLHLVLTGQRPNPNLLARYAAWKAYQSKKPMPRDTQNIEKLLIITKSSRDLVRSLIAEGAPMEHIYEQMGRHIDLYSARLTELREHNARQPKDAEAPAAQGQPTNA